MPDQRLSSHKPINLPRLDRVTTDKLARDGELPTLHVAHALRQSYQGR